MFGLDSNTDTDQVKQQKNEEKSEGGNTQNPDASASSKEQTERGWVKARFINPGIIAASFLFHYAGAKN